MLRMPFIIILLALLTTACGGSGNGDTATGDNAELNPMASLPATPPSRGQLPTELLPPH